MKIAEAKCLNCGATLKVDADTHSGVCQHCGSAFITQDVINNYNTVINNTAIQNTVTNNTIQANNVNILNGDFDNLKKLAFDAWQGQNYEAAYNYFSKALEIKVDTECSLYGALAFGWLTKFKSNNLNFTNSTFKTLLLDQSSIDLNKINGYLIQFNDLIIAIERMTMNNYNEGYPNDYIVQTINKNLRLCCNAYNIIICIYEKYGLNASIPQDYVTELKNYADTLAKLITKKIYKPGNTGGLVDYRKIVIQDVEDVTRELHCIEDKIRKIDSSYQGEKIKVGGCYIATCVYGSYDCPQVWTLRRYRDLTLDTTWYGRLFIKIYYALSPTVVKLFGKRQWFQNFWKKKLDKKIAKLQKNGVEDTPYQDKY